VFRENGLRCPSCGVGDIHGRAKIQVSVVWERPVPEVGDVVHGQVFMQGHFPQLRLFNEPNRRARFDGGVPGIGQWIAASVLEVGPKSLIVSFKDLLPEDLVLSARAWGTEPNAAAAGGGM
jgi:hypothetical protein